MKAKFNYKTLINRSSPQRTCIATHTVHNPDNLIRLVLSPENKVVPDILSCLPGRGVWVTNSYEVLAHAISKKAFDRAWKRKVIVPKELLKCVDKSLEQRALSLLSLANKAGCVICGYEKAKRLIDNVDRTLLLQAIDSSAEGRQKLHNRYHSKCKALEIEPITVDFFTISQISLALGKLNVVHAALDYKIVTDKFAKAAIRVKNFRSNGVASVGNSFAPFRS
ncbi:MAG: hypothetical protein TECD_00674 [Hyphomicrobiaceae bacterium hypho_1]